MPPARTAAPKLADAAPVFAALGDGTRLRLVARLCDEGPLSIARLADGEPVSRQAVTKHLEALEEARLVRSARSGRERVWELRPERLADATRFLEHVSARWDAAIERLRTLVE
jgi:DNA-binding transcriptional ArsR family regulator